MTLPLKNINERYVLIVAMVTTGKNVLTKIFNYFLSEKTEKKAERIILFIALVSFFVHLAAIYLVKFGLIDVDTNSELLQNPISAIYTPFSFILIYEVYLLIYYLPRSFTTYITKQYEIITLIIIRKLFKDLAAVELTSNWFEIKGDLQFTYDIVASILLFYLIFLFQKQGKKKMIRDENFKNTIKGFVNKKKILALSLIPLFFGMAIYTFINWSAGIQLSSNDLEPFKSINNLFFDEFFTILILVDVVLLLISFFYTNKFHKIIRNSGFVISTILIRMSFGVSGLISTILIVSAVLFGLAILVIHNKYEENSTENME
jgi:hypothetical protein